AGDGKAGQKGTAGQDHDKATRLEESLS
ncbi:MAG: hypothetical protein K0R61_2979, partial [Microvirga sp.]|nr:hypothetical protein [Microvirga sp.]